MAEFILSQIIVYPVKSLAGICINSHPVTEKGLQHDRKWMLIDHNRQFLSQRTLPTMALIKTELTDQNLILSAAGMENLSLPLEPVDGQIISTTIWDDQCDARSVSTEADQWLSDFLKQDCQLVYQPDETIRPVDPEYSQPTDKVGFADGFSFLIISENSLVVLNHQMQLNLPMLRFRPNLVISGCPGYAEDSWRKISIGAIDFRLPKPCSRCMIPTINPETAQVGKEPITTLSNTRKWQNKVYFGQNALHDKCGLLTVGDAVQIKLTGAKQPPI